MVINYSLNAVSDDWAFPTISMLDPLQQTLPGINSETPANIRKIHIHQFTTIGEICILSSKYKQTFTLIIMYVNIYFLNLPLY